MTYIDLAILDLIEHFCRAFQRLTGKTNIWLAVQLTNVSVIIYFVWAALYFWKRDMTSRLFVGAVCGGVFYGLTKTVFKVSIEVYESAAFQRVARGLRNPRRLRDSLLRISFLTLCCVLSYPILFVYVNLHANVVLLTYSLIVLTTAILYLLACDPLPPAPAKARAWFRRLVPTRSFYPWRPKANNS